MSGPPKIAANLIESLTISVPARGVWVAEVRFNEDAQDIPVGSAVTIEAGDVQLVGTIDEDEDGTHALRRSCTVVGGAGGWQRFITPRDYQSDAGIRARTVADDLAREVGETIDGFVPTAERVGKHFARDAVRASALLELVIGETYWWVDYAGRTNVGPRIKTRMTDYQVLAYDPQQRFVELALDDLTQLAIGATVSERLDVPQEIRSYVVTQTREGIRARCWTGGADGDSEKLAEIVRSIIQQLIDQSTQPLRRYRVLGMSGDRVELQAVNKELGIPDLTKISVMPGLAGCHAQLQRGAEVLVAFVDGDRTQPVIVAFAGKDGVGFVPDMLTLGGNVGAPSARMNDTVEVLLPPLVISGTVLVGGVPSALTGVALAPIGKTTGVITGGSSRVKVAP